MTVPPLVFCVRGFGEPFDRAESPVPLSGELSHSPGGLVEAAGFYLVENFPALFAPADQPGPFEHDQMFGDSLAGERHPSGQPAGAYLTVADQQVEDPAARRVGDGRPQLVIGLRRHPGWRFASNVARRSRYVAPAALVLAGIALFLRVGPAEQLMAAFDHTKTGPLVALGCQRELDEHRVAGHRLLPARGGSSGMRSASADQQSPRRQGRPGPRTP